MKFRATTYQRGFTFVEMAVALFLFTMLISAAFLFIRYFSESYTFSFNETAAVDQAEQGVRLMMQELRQAHQGDDGAYPLQLVADQELIFFSNIDSDPATERVHYFLEDTLLKKGVTEPAGNPPAYPAGDQQERVIADYVRNGTAPIFYYYNGDWPADTVNNPLNPPTLADTKMVRTVLRINVYPEQHLQDFELDSSIQLRNLKTNL